MKKKTLCLMLFAMLPSILAGCEPKKFQQEKKPGKTAGSGSQANEDQNNQQSSYPGTQGSSAQSIPDPPASSCTLDSKNPKEIYGCFTLHVENFKDYLEKLEKTEDVRKALELAQIAVNSLDQTDGFNLDKLTPAERDQFLNLTWQITSKVIDSFTVLEETVYATNLVILSMRVSEFDYRLVELLYNGG